MPKKKTVSAVINKKTEKINKFSNELEDIVLSAQKNLSRSVLKSFVDKLERSGSKIANSTKNKLLVSNIDTVFADFIKTNGQEIIDAITNGVDSMVSVNREYYKGQASAEILNKASRIVRTEISQMLGIGDGGKIAKGGYLENILTDNTVKAKIKNFARRSILTQQDYSKFSSGIDAYINGSDKKQGVLQQFYKETAFDTIAQADRIASTVYAGELKLVFAIYEGGIVPNSRSFCREKNGKVFHIGEILKWKPTVAVPPNYNPIIDLGGYGCRHHLNWVSVELALRLRPDVKKFI